MLCEILPFCLSHNLIMTSLMTCAYFTEYDSINFNCHQECFISSTILFHLLSKWQFLIDVKYEFYVSHCWLKFEDHLQLEVYFNVVSSHVVHVGVSFFFFECFSFRGLLTSLSFFLFLVYKKML